MTWGIWLIFTKAISKVSKLEIWWDPFVQSRKCMGLKFTNKLCVMTMENNAKYEEELNCQFKIDMRNLRDFDLITSKTCIVIDCFWPKYTYNIWAKKVQRSCVWWHLILMLNFEGKLTCAFKNHMKNLVNFHQSTRRFQNQDFNGILLSKAENA